MNDISLIALCICSCLCPDNLDKDGGRRLQAPSRGRRLPSPFGVSVCVDNSMCILSVVVDVGRFAYMHKN